MIELLGLASAVALLVVGGLWFAFHKGWIGLSAERLAKMRERVDELQDKFDETARKKQAKLSGPVPSASLSSPTDMVATLTAAKASLDAGLITQADYDNTKAKFLP